MANLSSNLARDKIDANVADFSLNFRRETAANLMRANLTICGAPSKQDARISLSSNLIATSKTLGFCQDRANQIYAKDKFAKASVNLKLQAKTDITSKRRQSCKIAKI